MTTMQTVKMSDYVKTPPTNRVEVVTLGLFCVGTAPHPALAAQVLLQVDEAARGLTDEEWDRAVEEARKSLDAFRAALQHAILAATDPTSIQ